MLAAYGCNWQDVSFPPAPVEPVEPAKPTKAENLDSYGDKEAVAEAPKASKPKGPRTAEAIALQLAESYQGPCMVRFVNTTPKDARTPEGKLTQKSVMSSQSFIALWGANQRVGNEALCLATKNHFEALLSVEVSEIHEKDSPKVNRVNAPALVVLGPVAEGQRKTEVLEGKISPNQVLDAVKKIVPGVKADKLASAAKEYTQKVLDVKALKDQLRIKQELLARKGGSNGQIEGAIAQIEKEIVAAESELEALKAKLQG